MPSGAGPGAGVELIWDAGALVVAAGAGGCCEDPQPMQARRTRGSQSGVTRVVREVVQLSWIIGGYWDFVITIRISALSLYPYRIALARRVIGAATRMGPA